MFNTGIKKWEIALAMGVAAAVFCSLVTLSRDAELENKMIRLHVIAASNSAEDQALKLKVRDAVLDVCEPILDKSGSVEESKQRLQNSGQVIQDAALKAIKDNGYTYDATVEVTKAAFETREYGSFALPAGKYETLRVTIGEGEGQNWWCVVFPPLCAAAATETLEEEALAAGLTDEDISLITRESEQYVLRFKLLEWWESIADHFSDGNGE